MDAGTIILTLVGIGIIIVGVLLILQLRQAGIKSGEDAKQEVVVRREVDVNPVGWGWAGGWLPSWGYQPYYSRMPMRPLLY
jgi:hypothetical protein